MRKTAILIFLLGFGVGSTFAAVSVNWNASGAFNLYNSSGGQYNNTGSLLIQLVIDQNSDTDFGSLVSDRVLGINSETAFGGVHSTATDDRVEAWAQGYWFNGAAQWYAFSADGVTTDGQTSEIPDTYASDRFYFRWFNAETLGAATEVGFIWDTAWTTPAVLGTPVDQNIDYTTVSASPTYGGTEFNGAWQSVAPVPEPGTMALFALGLVTLAASRRRRSVKA